MLRLNRIKNFIITLLVLSLFSFWSQNASAMVGLACGAMSVLDYNITYQNWYKRCMGTLLNSNAKYCQTLARQAAAGDTNAIKTIFYAEGSTPGGVCPPLPRLPRSGIRNGTTMF